MHMQSKEHEVNIYCESQHQVPLHVKHVYVTSGFKKAFCKHELINAWSHGLYITVKPSDL